MGFKYYISTKNDGSIAECNNKDYLLNRKRVLDLAKLDSCTLFSMNQVHGNDLAFVDSKKLNSYLDNKIPNVDALVTNEKNIVLLAQSADCPLIILYNQKKNILAVVHSGWKGTQKNIISKVLLYMSNNLFCDHSFTKVVFSPFAKNCCYSVGKEFLNIFSDYSSAFSFIKDVLYFDLGYVLLQQLKSNNIKQKNILFSEVCTICNDSYFSYRKEKNNAGRFGIFAWLDD
jgi:polyphenol oxidase